jgi:hypothetical protein
MKVRVLRAYNRKSGEPAVPGTEIEEPDNLARELIHARKVEPVGAEPAPTGPLDTVKAGAMVAEKKEA